MKYLKQHAGGNEKIATRVPEIYWARYGAEEAIDLEGR